MAIIVFAPRYQARCVLSYHPHSDCQTERLNRTLEEMLRMYIRSDELEWERLLPALELAYNRTCHSTTKLSPFGVMFGEDPLGVALDGPRFIYL